MIPYKTTFVIDDKLKEAIHFESNEKPFKGEVYTIENADGKLWEAKVTEVTKIIIRNKSAEGSIEYRCKIEKHEPTLNSIGFGKKI